MALPTATANGLSCTGCAADHAAAVDASPTAEPVTAAACAYRTRDTADERCTAKRAERRAAAATDDAPRCATCDTQFEPSDNYCRECGSPFRVPASVSVNRARAAMPYALAGYSTKNQERILPRCPNASGVRGFRAWLKAGGVVRKGQKGIKIVAPEMGTSDGTTKLVTIKPTWVFDVTQTDERTQGAPNAA
jgi:hypothetical protein